MTKSLAYIGVLALVVGLVLTTCVGTAWSLEVLSEDELAAIWGSWPNDGPCLDWPCITAEIHNCGEIAISDQGPPDLPCYKYVAWTSEWLCAGTNPSLACAYYGTIFVPCYDYYPGEWVQDEENPYLWRCVCEYQDTTYVNKCLDNEE